MSEVFWLYIITRLNSISGVAFTIGLIGTIIMVIAGVVWLASTPDPRYTKDSQEHDLRYQNNAIKIMQFWYVVFIAWSLYILTPQKDDALFIISGTGLIEIAKSDTAKSIANKSVQIVEKYLDSIEDKVDSKPEEQKK